MEAVIAAVLPLPLVPAMCTNFSCFSGLPIRASSSRVRSSPGTLPFQQTEWMYSMASFAFMKVPSFGFQGYDFFDFGGQTPRRSKIFARNSRKITSTSRTMVMANCSEREDRK